MFQAIAKWWRRRQRRIDCEVLFPCIFDKADGNVRRFTVAVVCHVSIDRAWRFHDEWYKDCPDVVGMVVTAKRNGWLEHLGVAQEAGEG